MKTRPLGGRSSRQSKTKVCRSVLQLNAEGLTNAKLEVVRQLADSNQVAVVLLQETHRTTDDNLKLPGFLLAGSILSKQHGMATFVRIGLTWSAVKRSQPDSKHRMACHRGPRNNYRCMLNVYKPPPSELYTTSLPSLPAPAICAGDFSCQHTDWGYIHTTKDGETLSDWASSAEVVLLKDQKEPRASSLRDGTHTPTRTWHSPWAVAATQSQNDASLTYSPGHTIGRLTSKCHRWFSR